MSKPVGQRIHRTMWCFVGIFCSGSALVATEPATTPEPVPQVQEDQATSALAAVPGLDSRKQPARKAFLEAYGGNEKTEKAVAAGVNWIARHQLPDGSWSLGEFPTACKGTPCAGPGIVKSNSAATALALLPLLGADQTHKDAGPHQKTVSQGVDWLLKNQKPDGDLRCGSSMYSHGLAAIALGEAYGLTRDRLVGRGAQQAINFIIAAQHPKTGGWRYSPGDEGDTSVVGWQMAALHSAQAAGLKVEQKALDGAKVFLQSCAQGQGGKFSYTPGGGATPTMTAVGLLCRQYTGIQRDDPILAEGQGYLMGNAPGRGGRNLYYWYYAS